MFEAGAEAVKIGAVAAASSILAGAGMEVFAFGGATEAPAAFKAGGDEGEGSGAGVKVEVMVGGDEGEGSGAGVKVEVMVGGGGAAAGTLVAAIAILGATTAGASAGSWI